MTVNVVNETLDTAFPRNACGEKMRKNKELPEVQKTQVSFVSQCPDLIPNLANRTCLNAL